MSTQPEAMIEDGPLWPDPPPTDVGGWWEWLWTNYSKMSFLYALKLVHNRDDAEDILSIVFLKAGRSLAQHPERAVTAMKLRPWLNEITRNAVLDWQRKKRPRPFSDLGGAAAAEDEPNWDPPSPDEFSPVDTALANEQEAAMERCIEQLSKDAREVFDLRYIVGLKIQQIADQLAIQFDAASQRVNRATKRVRSCVEAALAC